MDSLITAAARALAAGDPLGALKRVALRDDPAALALRGIAMAQLGELPRARDLLRQAARAFGPHETLARARCVVAEAEVALALREAVLPTRTTTPFTLSLSTRCRGLRQAQPERYGMSWAKALTEIKTSVSVPQSRAGCHGAATAPEAFCECFANRPTPQQAWAGG